MNAVAQHNMISQQLRTNNILNDEILSLFETMPREAFVPQAYESVAYADFHIPLEFGECMMTPLEEAQVLQALKLKGHETVLEIGTGTGFLTALLSKRCKKVISFDIHATFTERATKLLHRQDCHNVDLQTGNAFDGWIDHAPYDCIVFTGAISKLNEKQRSQLSRAGRLFVIVGKSPVMQAQLHTLNADNTWKQEFIFETDLPALQNSHPHPIFIF